MKIPITDQFLWELYNFLEKANNASSFIFRRPTMRNYLPGPKNPIIEKYRNEKNRKKFNKLIYYLKKNNYIKVKNLENKQAIIITKRGIGKAIKASFSIEGGKKRKDGMWIMLTFDIPQNHRKARNLLRSVLLNLGYRMFQQSIWVTPYDVSDKTEKLLQLYSLDQYVKIFLVEEID